MTQPPKLGGQGHLRGVKASNWHQYTTSYLLIPEQRSTLFCKTGYHGLVKKKQNPHCQKYVTDTESFCGLLKVLDLRAEKRMLNVIIHSYVNRGLMRWVSRSHFSPPLSAESPLHSSPKQHMHKEATGGIWSHAVLGSLTSLILSFLLWKLGTYLLPAMMEN